MPRTDRAQYIKAFVNKKWVNKRAGDFWQDPCCPGKWFYLVPYLEGRTEALRTARETSCAWGRTKPSFPTSILIFFLHVPGSVVTRLSGHLPLVCPRFLSNEEMQLFPSSFTEVDIWDLSPGLRRHQGSDRRLHPGTQSQLTQVEKSACPQGWLLLATLPPL